MAADHSTATVRRSVSDAVTPAQVRAQVERIVSSRAFIHSDRMVRFLRFTVEESLAGRADQLKEYLLGTEVFDRPSTFDPRLDPIVRVEARRLRSKLAQYYETEGRNDPVAIHYPKGSYGPSFRNRDLSPERGTAPVEHAKTIAVLPFANLSADPEKEYFSDGLTEELIQTLTKVQGLRVVAWNSASRLKGRDHDIRAIAAQLNVAHVLEGSVRWAGDRLRITAQLIDADGAYLWSETYERASRDIFAIQDEISRAIVDTLRVQLVKGGSAPLVKRYGEDIEIHNVFLKGRYHSNRRTEEGLTKSIDFFEEVIEKNSRHALAYAGLAESYSMLGEYSIQAPTLVMPKAKAAALKALELDPTLAEAYTSLAFIRSRYDWAWREAEEHYRRAIELNPGHSTARHWYGSDYLAILGRFEEGMAEIREALKVDPLSLIAGTSLGFTFVAMRRYDEAITQFRSLIDLDPHFFKGYSGLARAYVQKGEYDVGIALFKKAQELSGDLTYVLGSLGQSYALAGNRAAAEECLAKLLELSSQRFVPATSIALIYAGLGESDYAFEWLDRACDRREIPLGFLKVYPSYDPLRSDPRFTTLLARVGL